MPLRIEVTSATQQGQFEHDYGPLEFGRGPRRDVPRFVLDDASISRDQLRIEELADGLIRVENLSATQAIEVEDGERVAMRQWRTFPPPLCLTVRRTKIVIQPKNGSGAAPARPPGPISTSFAAPVDGAAMAQSSVPDARRMPPGSSADAGASRLPESGAPAGDGTLAAPMEEIEAGLVALESEPEVPRRSGFPAAQTNSSSVIEHLTEWLHAIVELQQAAPGSAEFFQRTAQAMLDLLGMDQGMVLLASEHGWNIAATAGTRHDGGARYSRTLVEYVAKNRRTFYQDLQQMVRMSLSLARVEAAVAAPIFGLQNEVAGVLYGSRSRGIFARGPVGPLEAQLAQLLAASVGANLARSSALRTRVQFEQFFSPELVRELEQNPNLLEGRSQEVTLVFTDLRGFTALSQRLGAERTCRMVRDMMEGLSEQIVAQGGVIVDYAGDGILAMWNAPTEQPDHAVRACRAALAMLGELPQINQRWGQEAGNALSLGIGINSGPAQVGNTGSSRKFKYGPHGHTVNVASRVQDATKILGSAAAGHRGRQGPAASRDADAAAGPGAPARGRAAGRAVRAAGRTRIR